MADEQFDAGGGVGVGDDVPGREIGTPAIGSSTSVTPSPARAAAIVAPCDPMISCDVAPGRSSSRFVSVERMPEPCSRSSHVAAAGSNPSAAPGAPTTVSAFSRTARTRAPKSPGGLPATTTSTSWWRSIGHTAALGAKSTPRVTCGWRARDDASSAGSRCSPAVVTAPRRTWPRRGSASLHAAVASSSRPRIRRA